MGKAGLVWHQPGEKRFSERSNRAANNSGTLKLGRWCVSCVPQRPTASGQGRGGSLAKCGQGRLQLSIFLKLWAKQLKVTRSHRYLKRKELKLLFVIR